MFADPGGSADSDTPCSLAHHLRSKSASHTGQTAVMVAASYVWPAGDEARRSPQVVDCEAVGIPPNPTRLSAESSFNEVGSGFRAMCGTAPHATHLAPGVALRSEQGGPRTLKLGVSA